MAQFVPVQWNRNKYLYDAVVILLAGAYLAIFLKIAPDFTGATRPLDPAVLRARAFGSCAFLMLTVILCIGPLAKLDKRFLPLLYNRRHFGVMTCLVALAHAKFILDWYFAFSPTPQFQALLSSNTSYGQALGFPFEAFGIFALTCLSILAATSHDFWLEFLTPRVWKALHFLIYFAYASVVAHVSLGVLQELQNPLFGAVVGACAFTVAGLHLAAARAERRERAETARRNGHDPKNGWIPICSYKDIPEGRACIGLLPTGERVAVFRHSGNKLNAVSNACAHQNGPLGEGKIVYGCVTCPWHGFQYDPTTGRSPPPFTEKIPTYNLRLMGDFVMVDPSANKPGTYVEPVIIPGAQPAKGAS